MIGKDFIEKIKLLNQRHIVLFNAIKGGLGGYFILHPFIVAINEIMHYHSEFKIMHFHPPDRVFSAILMAFEIQMLPWATAFTLFGIALGFHYGEVQLQLEKQRVELEQSNNLKDLFIDIMRHDLLNPATVSKDIAKMAFEEEEDLEKKELIKRILKNNEKMITMIENASLLAKIESGEKIEVKETELTKVLRKAALDMTPQADEKNIKIIIDLKDEYLALTNPLVYDVFSNLINNAIKYSPKNSKIEVGIDEDGEYWNIYVADNGLSIPVEDKEAIFDRFKRAHKGGVKGTGLGLAIVKKVVEAHKGRVWVEDNPDGGSIFFVLLPKLKKSNH